MNKSKHTNGPWNLSTTGKAHLPYAITATTEPGMPVDEIALISAAGFHGPDLEANARLIAAAPEMLSLLKFIAAHGCRSPDECQIEGICEGCEAAELVAKAEGRTND